VLCVVHGGCAAVNNAVMIKKNTQKRYEGMSLLQSEDFSIKEKFQNT